MTLRVHSGNFDLKFPGVIVRADTTVELSSIRQSAAYDLEANTLLSLPDSDFISAVARATVVDHETRHFHDALLFPFGIVALRQRLVAGLNGFRAIFDLANGPPFNVIPVPLQEWLHYPAAARTEFLRVQSAIQSRELVAPELPVVDRFDNLSDADPAHTGEATTLLLLRLALIGYRSLSLLWTSPHSPGEEMVAPASCFWESSAYLTQLAAISQLASPACADRFHSWVAAHDRLPYSRGIRILHHVFPAGFGDPTLRDMQCLATWSQMGSYSPIDENSAPERRLSALLDAASRGFRWNRDDGVMDLIARWDSTLETESIAPLRAARSDAVRAVAEQLRRAAARSRFFDPYRRLFDRYVEQNSVAVDSFLADPDTYTDPVAYFRARGRYADPAVAAEYSGADASSDLPADIFDITPAGADPAISMDLASSMYALGVSVDDLFRASSRTVHRPTSSRLLGHPGVTPLRGFNWISTPS